MCVVVVFQHEIKNLYIILILHFKQDKVGSFAPLSHKTNISTVKLKALFLKSSDCMSGFDRPPFVMHKSPAQLNLQNNEANKIDSKSYLFNEFTDDSIVEVFYMYPFYSLWWK